MVAAAVVEHASPAASSALAVAVSDQIVEVEGGLAIPFYVVMLAMLGAGINMTRKVPEIQKTYDTEEDEERSLLGTALRAPMQLLMNAGSDKHIDTTPEIRKELIDAYMYFLSAPFLAIAVYYLLQVMANSVAEPVLVVLAFSTGLMSNTVVGSIVVFADSVLKKTQERCSVVGEAEPQAETP